MHPDNWVGWVAQADALVRLDRHKDAEKALRRAEALAPPDYLPDICTQWGHFHDKRCDLKSAEHWHRRALKHKETTRTLIFLGAVLARQGRFLEAKQHFKRAIHLATDPPDEAYYNLGLVFRAERRYKEALRCFQNAIKLDPEYTLAKKARKDVLRAIRLKK